MQLAPTLVGFFVDTPVINTSTNYHPTPPFIMDGIVWGGISIIYLI